MERGMISSARVGPIVHFHDNINASTSSTACFSSFNLRDS